MKDNKNITIGLLCMTAALLLTAVLLLNNSSSTANAAMSESRTGYYTMVAGEIDGTSSLIYILDGSTQRMNGYVLNLNTRTIDLVPGAQANLKAAFEGGPAPAAPAGR